MKVQKVCIFYYLFLFILHFLILEGEGKCRTINFFNFEPGERTNAYCGINC